MATSSSGIQFEEAEDTTPRPATAAASSNNGLLVPTGLEPYSTTSATTRRQPPTAQLPGQAPATPSAQGSAGSASGTATANATPRQEDRVAAAMTLSGSGSAVTGAPYPPKVLGDVVLRLRNVSKSFRIANSEEVVNALEDISLCEPTAPGQMCFPPIRQGEFVMIRGPSGGGKTTLLNIIGTIDSPTSGTVELLGKSIDASSDDDYLSDLRLKYLGFVFQTFNLLATMSALENVELPMTLLGTLNADERRRRAKQLLALVGLRNRAGHLPSELSGGEQQRTTIARSLANNPCLLLLDEPTGDLDTTTTIDVMDLLMRINHLAGTTCIMVTHNPDVECYADRILYVEDGRFVRQVTNAMPVPLVKEDYAEYLKKMDGPQGAPPSTAPHVHTSSAHNHQRGPHHLGSEAAACAAPLSHHADVAL